MLRLKGAFGPTLSPHIYALAVGWAKPWYESER